MFSFLFQHFFHFSRKHDLSQGYSSFTRFCADDCNFHSFFLWLRETCCGLLVSQVLGVSSFWSGACVCLTCVFVWQLMWAPEDASSVTYFLRMFSEDIRESIGNQVKPLQCLDCKIDKRASVSQALLPLLKVKWQDRLQHSGTARKQLALCKTN